MEHWEESCDNEKSGLDVSWAFQKDNVTDLEISEHFYKELIIILNSNIDNEVDYINYVELDYK